VRASARRANDILIVLLRRRQRGKKAQACAAQTCQRIRAPHASRRPECHHPTTPTAAAAARRVAAAQRQRQNAARLRTPDSAALYKGKAGRARAMLAGRAQEQTDPGVANKRTCAKVHQQFAVSRNEPYSPPLPPSRTDGSAREGNIDDSEPFQPQAMRMQEARQSPPPPCTHRQTISNEARQLEGRHAPRQRQYASPLCASRQSQLRRQPEQLRAHPPARSNHSKTSRLR